MDHGLEKSAPYSTRVELKMKQQIHELELKKLQAGISGNLSEHQRLLIEHALERGDVTVADGLLKAIRAQALSASGGGGVSQAVAEQPGLVCYSPFERLKVRMGWARSANPPIKTQFIEDGDKVFLFGVKNGESFTIVEDDALFPSDTLVTQLRMVVNA